MVHRLALIGLLLLGAVGCAAPEPVAVAADCQGQIRLDDVVYTSYDHTQTRGERHAPAEVAECHDVGVDAPGPVFVDDGDQVMTWTVDGYPPDEVLAVRRRGIETVYVADSLSGTERERIYRELERR